MDATYTLKVGDEDAERLALLNGFYNPSSRALLDAVGLKAGDSILDVGCGHGVMTEWMAQRVGPTGSVYAVDASGEQLAVARARLSHSPQVQLIQARVEDLVGKVPRVDFVYGRFLLLHLADPAAALGTMAALLHDEGRLVIEEPDVDAVRFVPGGAESELWKGWWHRLGQARGFAVDVCSRADALIRAAGLHVESRDRFQPVTTRPEAKRLHVLGFKQLIADYTEHSGATPEAIEAHLSFLRDAMNDPRVEVELYVSHQYVASRRRMH